MSVQESPVTFSLCIPTMNRFETFLKDNLTKYLQNAYISEIVITDEDGSGDYDKITTYFNDPKIKVFKNDTKLGPFLNKLKACRLASNEWIVLIDSDNYADVNYFETASQYILQNINSDNSKTTILAPSFARPRFDYRHLGGRIMNKTTIRELCEHDNRTNRNMVVLMNTGNYVINQYLINNLNISAETENIKKSSACDVIYINMLMFEQFDISIHIVSGLEYDHCVHDGSIYTKTCNDFVAFNQAVHEKYYAFCRST